MAEEHGETTKARFPIHQSPVAASRKDASRQERRRELVCDLDTLVGIMGPLPPGVTVAVRAGADDVLRHCLLFQQITSLVIRLPSKTWIRENVTSLGVRNINALDNIRLHMRTNTDWNPVRQLTWRSDRGVVLTPS